MAEPIFVPIFVDGHADVPSDLAKCPECGDALCVEVMAWARQDGEPHEVSVSCVNEDLCGGCGHSELDHHVNSNDAWGSAERNPRCLCSEFEDSHRGRQSDWQPVIDLVEPWAKKTLRVRDR